MPYNGNGPYSPLIITPEMQTPPATALEAAAQMHRARAAELSQIQASREATNALREQSVRSPGSVAMHNAYREGVQQLRILGELHTSAAALCEQEAAVLRDVDRQQGNIDRAAHEKISAAKTKVEIPVVVSEHRASAQMMSTRAAQDLSSSDARWHAKHGATMLGLGGRLTQAPGGDPIKPAPNPSPGITKPLDEKRWGHKGDQTEQTNPERGTENQAGSDGHNLGKRAGEGIGKEAPSGAQAERGNPVSGADTGAATGMPGGTTPRSSFSPMTSMPSAGSGGGSSGGGMGSGLGGGGANPLSSIMNGGLGQNPASSLGSGLTGGPNPAASASSSGLTNPGAAFARGFSGGSSAVSPVSSAVPPPAASSAPVAGAQPLSSAGAAASSAPAGASGVHSVAAAPVSASGVGAGASVAPGMFPSTGMGAGPGGAAVAPVGSTGGSTAGGGAAVAASGAAGAPAAANAGPTLVPAAMVSSALSSRSGRELSADAMAAATLAWQLQHACRAVGFPMDWAVGVFRSESGTEMVVVSSEGSSYVPAGVFVPRGATLLTADPLVDKGFRDCWFGWPDPAQVMVEYARLRHGLGWDLVAAASNGPIDHFRAYGTEFADPCTYERSPFTVDDPAPALDEMHAHRLQLEFSDLFDRLVRLTEADHLYADRVMIPIAAELVSAAQGLEHPIELTHLWSTLTGGGTPTAEQWSQFAQVAATTFLTASVMRPDVSGGPEDWKTVLYQEAWTVSRALEFVAGWAAQPMPLADMAYAAIAADPGGEARDKIVRSLREIEIELGWI